MAQQSLPPPTANDPLKPGTFRSILPILDDILSILHDQGTSKSKDTPPNVQASEAIAPKAKELAMALEEMKAASIALPGGHLSTEEVKRLTAVLEEEGEKRRQILDAFGHRQMPYTDELGSKSADPAVDGDVVEADSAMPSPAQAS